MKVDVVKTHSGKYVFGNNDKILFSEKRYCTHIGKWRPMPIFGCLIPLIHALGKNKILAT